MIGGHTESGGLGVYPAKLLEKLPREEIEARELINDPLQAVPNLPFGHPNDVWCRLLEQLPED